MAKNTNTTTTVPAGLNPAIGYFVGTSIDSPHRRSVALGIAIALYEQGEPLKPYGFDGKVAVMDVAAGDDGTKKFKLACQGTTGWAVVPVGSDAHFEAAARLSARKLESETAQRDKVVEAANKLGKVAHVKPEKAAKPRKNSKSDADLF